MDNDGMRHTGGTDAQRPSLPACCSLGTVWRLVQTLFLMGAFSMARYLATRMQSDIVNSEGGLLLYGDGVILMIELCGWLLNVGLWIVRIGAAVIVAEFVLHMLAHYQRLPRNIIGWLLWNLQRCLTSVVHWYIDNPRVSEDEE